MACTVGSRQLILYLVRPMRALVLVAVLLASAGCMKKEDSISLPSFTRVEVSRSNAPDSIFPADAGREEAPAVRAFTDTQRSGWTRAIGVGFGPPSPAYYAHLHDGDRYVGYFAVGAGVLPGTAAFFQVHFSGMYAQKRITRAEANQFLDVIGVGGELR